MLSTLGTLSERRQEAFDALKSCRLKTGQSPTDLLNYMRPLWEEVGETNEDRMVNEFISALSDPIRKDLDLLPRLQLETLPEVEEHANVIFRRRQRSYGGRDGGARDSRKRRGSDASGEGTKPAKRARMGQKPPKRSGTGDARPDGHSVVCWTCRQRGHKSPDCPQRKDKLDGAPEPRPGNGKGQKA
jgi:hypothetical protein